MWQREIKIAVSQLYHRETSLDYLGRPRIIPRILKEKDKRWWLHKADTEGCITADFEDGGRGLHSKECWVVRNYRIQESRFFRISRKECSPICSLRPVMDFNPTELEDNNTLYCLSHSVCGIL